MRSLYALVSHLCPTGLPEVAMPYSDMWQDCQITLQHTRPCYAKSSYRLVDPQTLHGNVPQVNNVPSGPTNSAAITTLRLSGGKPLVMVTRERRYGPSRLRVNDDDSVTVHMPLLTAARAFGLRRRRWSSPQQCQLCCLRTVLFHIKHHYQHQTCFIAPIGTSCGLFIPLVVQLPECLR